jgi:hypothetical protein
MLSAAGFANAAAFGSGASVAGRWAATATPMATAADRTTRGFLLIATDKHTSAATDKHDEDRNESSL